METADNIRTKAHLGFLKKEFDEHVVDTQEAIHKIERRSVVRNEQMISLDKKLDDVIDTLADSKLSTRKGIITQTIENTNNLSKIKTEMAAWKRASVIVGGLIAGIGMAARYLYALIGEIVKNE